MKLQVIWLFFFSAVVLYNECVGIPTSFTHKFNTSLHGWTLSEGFWAWSKNSTPDLATIPSFSSNANYVWIERPERGPFSMARTFHSRYIRHVGNDTKFYIRYWYYSSDPMGADHLMIYLMGTNSSQTPFPLQIIKQVSTTWVDAVIECELVGCCDYYDEEFCDLRMAIRASVGTNGSDGLVAIRCVSTIAGGCDDPTETTIAEATSTESTSADKISTETTTTEATTAKTVSTITTATASSPPTTTPECSDTTCAPESSTKPTVNPSTQHVTQTPNPNSSAYYSIPSYLIVVSLMILIGNSL